MKKTLPLFFLLVMPFIGHAQDWYQYFDGGDTSVFNSLQILLDTAETNVWQIGIPQKVIFDSAATFPNAILTDTIAPYPVDAHSSFVAKGGADVNIWFWGVLAVRWTQKLDLEQGKDFGLVEMSWDEGETWENAFDNPYVYNFYGFNEENVDTTEDGTIGFSGTDSLWKDIWLCYDMSMFGEEFPDLRIRYTLVSDSVDTEQEGWMIDNMMMHLTYVHTISEKQQEKYMKVYPSPTTGRVHIETKKFMEYHIIESMELVSITGQVMEQFGKRPTRTFVDLGHHPAGTYFLRVQTNKQTETFPVIISN